MVNGVQIRDQLSMLAVHRNFSHVFQKLKKPDPTCTESDAMMPGGWPVASRFPLKQRQHGVSAVARNHQRPAGSRPMLMFGKNPQPQYLVVPLGGRVSIRNKQLHMIDLLHLE